MLFRSLAAPILTQDKTTVVAYVRGIAAAVEVSKPSLASRGSLSPLASASGTAIDWGTSGPRTTSRSQAGGGQFGGMGTFRPLELV